MSRRTTSIATLSIAGLLSLSAWAQTPSSSGGGTIGGPKAAAPTGAATTHPPGTPGASDTPGTLQTSHPDTTGPANPSPADIRKIKKQARKAAHSSSPDK